MTAADDVARMLTLVPWLLERPGASLDEVAETFDVPARVIERDLYHLDFCGLPGLGGGALFDVSLLDDRIVVTMADELSRPLRPTRSEALRLLLTASSVEDVLGDEHPALRSAIGKVRDALEVPPGATVVVEPSAGDTVQAVRRALGAGTRVVVLYQGRGDDAPQRREIDPWALHVEDGVWYLQGHDHGAGDRRTFRLDRAADVEVVGDPIEVPAPDDLPPPRYVPGRDDLEVEVEVTAAGRWLLDAWDVDEVIERDDGSALLRLRTDAPGWVARTVLTAGGAASVRAPASLATRVADTARAALAAYGEPT